MPGKDGGGGTLDGGCPGELIPDRKSSSCYMLGDGGTTTTKRNSIISLVMFHMHKKTRRRGVVPEYFVY